MKWNRDWFEKNNDTSTRGPRAICQTFSTLVLLVRLTDVMYPATNIGLPSNIKLCFQSYMDKVSRLWENMHKVCVPISLVSKFTSNFRLVHALKIFRVTLETTSLSWTVCNLLQLYFIHHKYHLDYTEIKRRLLWRGVTNFLVCRRPWTGDVLLLEIPRHGSRGFVNFTAAVGPTGAMHISLLWRNHGFKMSSVILLAQRRRRRVCPSQHPDQITVYPVSNETSPEGLSGGDKAGRA